jgi:myo-inositol-1(or 4)-monophosphatase
VLQDDLLALALDAAAAAAALIVDARPRDIDTKSTPTDMVTEVDRAAEATITDRIRAVRPDDAVLGEEGALDTGTSGVRWIIDPIDGTTNFLYRFPAYAVSIAAEVDGEPTVAVVHDVVHNEVFTATRRGGAFLRRAGGAPDALRPLRVAGPPSLATALIGTGFAYAPERRTHQAAVLAALLGSVRDIRRTGSAALDQCWVAAGRLDGQYESGLQPWDLAAGRLIAAEAGAWVGEVAGASVAIVPQLAMPFAEALMAAHEVAAKAGGR